MKKQLFLAGILSISLLTFSACGLLKSGNTTAAAPAAATTTTTTTTTTASTYGQGAGAAIMNLYRQYKTDGKFDASNPNNIINALQLMANCTSLKENYKDKAYMAEYSQGLILGASGLINTGNVENVVNNLTTIAGEKIESATSKTNDALSQAATTTSNVLTQAATVANSASSIANLLSLFK